MRGQDAIGVAVRGPDGQIFGAQEPLDSILHRNRFARAPVLPGRRGALRDARHRHPLADALGVARRGRRGRRHRRRGARADAALHDRRSRSGLFVLLPLFVGAGRDSPRSASSVGGLAGRSSQHLIEGLIRVAIFVGYLLLVSRSAEIRRVFQYHGAEHMTIHALEHDAAADGRRTSRRYPTAHPRCGTEFLVVFIIVSILLFSLLAGAGAVGRILGRILLIPVIAAVAYEILRWGAKRRENCAGALAVPARHLAPVHHHQAARRLDDRGRHRVACRRRSRPTARRRPRAAWTPSVSRSPTPQAAAGASDDVRPPTAGRGSAPMPAADGDHRGGRMSLEARLDELERRLAEIEAEWSRPEVAADPERSRHARSRAGPDLAPVVDELPAAARRSASSSPPPAASARRETDPELRELAREVVDELEAEEATLVEAHPRPAAAARPERRARRHHRDPRRHRRRGGRPLRGRALPDVPPLRRAASLEGRAALRQRDRHRGPPRGHPRDPRATAPTAASSTRAACIASSASRETESSGRIHTSTATVAVLPEGRRGRRRHRRGQGPAHRGQALVRARAARASTRPTRRCASPTCRPVSSSRSRTRRASTRTRPRRWPCCAPGCWSWSSARRTRRRPPRAARMVGSGERSEKIRTYNFPQDRVTDHRIGMDLHDLPRVLDGDLDRLHRRAHHARPGRAPGPPGDRWRRHVRSRRPRDAVAAAGASPAMTARGGCPRR